MKTIECYVILKTTISVNIFEMANFETGLVLKSII